MNSNRNKKINKSLGFTLAELMIIIAVLTVLMAAFAPIFTSRYKRNADAVWSLATNDSYSDIYSDGPTKNMLQQSFVGLTPTSGADVRSDTFAPYSKLIIRSVANLDGAPQKQLEFRQNGERLGYLFAGNNNLLVGGFYNNLTIGSSCVALGICADGNTAFGVGALNSISTGYNNTALGVKALHKLTNGYNNTAVGYEVASESSTPSTRGNVFVGNLLSLSSSNYNTLVGTDIYSNASTVNTTVVGTSISTAATTSSVGIGSNTYVRGEGNTAVGAFALNPHSNNSTSMGYKYNTAIGYNSCSGLADKASKTTCIGGIGVTDDMASASKSMFNDENERVLIGGPVTSGPTASDAIKYAATLEVHNISGNNKTGPIPNLGNESVVVNGNLIVRGQPYLLGRSPYPFNSYGGVAEIKDYPLPALMGFTLIQNFGDISTFSPLVGDDGFMATKSIVDTESSVDQGKYKLKSAYNGHEHCICTYSCTNTTDKKKLGVGAASYDWSSYRDYSAIIPDYLGGTSFYKLNSGIKDYCGETVTNSSYEGEVILDKAHGLADYGSCCPILTGDGFRTQISDIRLKNIKAPYTLGLDYLDKLSIYNYNFKFDTRKQQHVGVIAQDLKNILPDAVVTNKLGYYSIKWENIFYTAVNSVKELNSKLIDLKNRIAYNYARLNKLKEENKQLEKRLDELSEELDVLEADKIISKYLNK